MISTLLASHFYKRFNLLITITVFQLISVDVNEKWPSLFTSDFDTS